MNNPRYRRRPSALLVAGLLFLCLFGMGCDLEEVSSPDPSRLDDGTTAVETNPSTESPAASDPSSPAPAPTPVPPSPSEPTTPAPAPTPVPITPPSTVSPTIPVVGGGSFLWDPRGDSVRVVIPASLAHWQFHVHSRRKHVTLFGPDRRGGNRDENVEYILPGGGAAWLKKSIDAGDDGTLLVFINTRDAATGNLKNAGWRIMNPSQRQSGDGDRLQPGENK
jgi:hypothetical protein